MHRPYIVFLLIATLGIMVVNGKSKYVFSLVDSLSQTIRPSGNVSWATVKELPILKGLSMRRLVLAPSGVREPHWHANANELGYCLVSPRLNYMHIKS